MTNLKFEFGKSSNPWLKIDLYNSIINDIIKILINFSSISDE